MELTDQERKQLEEIYNVLHDDSRVQKMKEIPMHRGSNCYIHSFKVAKLAIKRALRHKKQIDLKTLLLGCLLHDYYLYDWRVEKDKKAHHCSSHPETSIENAKRDFHIDEKTQDIIRRHMWPFNFKLVPNTTEARILTLADKTIFWREVLVTRKYKIRHKEKDEKFISSLF